MYPFSLTVLQICWRCLQISEDAMTQCRMSVMQQNEDVLADEIGCTADMTEEADYYADFHAYVDRTVTQVLREEHRISQNKGGWQSVPGSAQGCELMCKKVSPLFLLNFLVLVNLYAGA